MDIKSWQLIKEFSKVKVLVIGELMLDVYLKGSSNRISPEAPVPVVNITEESAYVGGAANVAANLRSLGAEVFFCSVCGNDAAAEKAFKLFHNQGINTDYVVVDEERTTLVKERIVVHDQILTRFDKGTETYISHRTQKRLISRIATAYNLCDAVVIADYDKGICAERVIEALTELQREHPLFIAVDSRHISNFRMLHPTLVKPNYTEAIRLLKIHKLESDRIEQIKRHGGRLCDITGSDISVVTMDKEGALAFKGKRMIHHARAMRINNPNVVGAGDTFISAISLSLVCGADLATAADLASAASAISVRKRNTACCNDLELRSFFVFKNKYISTLQELNEICEIYREQKKKIVFTNGCFDILHCGHVNYLKASGKLGDILIVGINNDDSIRRLKGTGRPVNPLADRIEVIAALTAVNHIISFGRKTDDSPSDLIRVIKPDIFAKGGDYTRELLPEASLVEALGGAVRFLPFTPDHSTTGVIRRIRETYAAD